MLVLTSAAGFYLGSDNGFQFYGFYQRDDRHHAARFRRGDAESVLGKQNRRADGAHGESSAARSGKLPSNEALIFGILQCVVAEIYLTFLVNGLTAILGLIVFIGYVLLYTPLKTRTSASTAIGAIPGALPPLMGLTSAANEITTGRLDFVCNSVSVAISAFSGDCLDVSGTICQSRNFDAARCRTGRKNHGAANRDFYDHCCCPSVLRRFLLVWQDGFILSARVFWDFGFCRPASSGAGENKRKSTQTSARFSNLFAFDFSVNGFQ